MLAQRAAAARVGRRRGRPAEPIERRLLALLATGAADDTIAHALGISRRTFFRTWNA